MSFYIINDKGVVSILHYELIQFIADQGFKKMQVGKSLTLVKVKDNRIYEATEADVIRCIKRQLEKDDEPVVMEKFAQGLSQLITTKKLYMLPVISHVRDRDCAKISRWYFQNTTIELSPMDQKEVPYSKIKNTIWNDRIIDKNMDLTHTKSRGQFEDFCWKLAKNNLQRFNALKSALGYLLHRYNNPALCKAVILLDENISHEGEANGGSGKSLIAQALSQCRELVIIEGKHLKNDSWFKNQRLEITTDLVCYDDVNRNFSLESLFSEITTGITIEKKRQHEIFLPASQAPKFLVTSNYVVLGPGGSSDRRRRYEFEVANYFSDKRTPLMEYGNLFFSGWNSEEWGRFYQFMMSCVQVFLKQGLIEAKPLNVKRNKLIAETDLAFYQFSKQGLRIGERVDKRKLLKSFKDKHPRHKDLSMKMFNKWLKIYAKNKGLGYTNKTSGGKSYVEFQIKKAA